MKVTSQLRSPRDFKPDANTPHINDNKKRSRSRSPDTSNKQTKNETIMYQIWIRIDYNLQKLHYSLIHRELASIIRRHCSVEKFKLYVPRYDNVRNCYVKLYDDDVSDVISKINKLYWRDTKMIADYNINTTVVG